MSFRSIVAVALVIALFHITQLWPLPSTIAASVAGKEAAIDAAGGQQAAYDALYAEYMFFSIADGTLGTLAILAAIFFSRRRDNLALGLCALYGLLNIAYFVITRAIFKYGVFPVLSSTLVYIELLIRNGNLVGALASCMRIATVALAFLAVAAGIVRAARVALGHRFQGLPR